MSLYAVIPAYNEEQNIKQCVSDWYPVIEKHNEDGNSRLVIIDDGSKDRTFEIIMELADSRPLLVLLTKENGGHGSAVLYGYRYAIEHNADWIFQTDSDGQTNPEEFDQFWKMKQKYDAVIGTRTERGDGAGRKFVENVVCFLLKLIFGVRVSDANAPFRLMKKELVETYIRKLPEDYNLPNIMLTTYFAYFNEKMKFIPISFQPRKAGKSSISPGKLTKIGWKAVGDFYTLRKEIDQKSVGSQ